MKNYEFRLYVAGQSPNSAQAQVRLDELCRKHLNGRHKIEIVDLLQNPERALRDNVLVTPTLIKLAPSPRRQIIGNLSEEDKLLIALGLKPETAE